MAYGVVRLTLYALIGAIEADLREAILSHLLVDGSSKELLPPVVYERAHARMVRDVGFSPTSETKIIEYLDFSECIEVLSSAKADLSEPLITAVKRIAKNSSVLTPIRNRVMHSRPLEYDDLAQVTNLASELLNFPDFLFPTLRQTEQFIKKDDSYVLSLSLESLKPASEKASHNLPIPDFDETGFLGRQQEETALVKLCKSSPWPVITIVGEGGVGKTALALKVAYSLLDDPDAGFDAIVWSTSKTTKLTVSDIKHIDGAIQTSVGVFRDVARTLVHVDATTDEVLEFLNSFKILLVLNNLETVLDDAIREFLAKITSSSKVLITSRIGLGELEYRYPLQGMKIENAVALLRATAQVRRVEQITRTSNSVLEDYCLTMKRNPLFIKWFVSSVQTGKRPEEILQNSKIFLDYCLGPVLN